MSKSCEFCGADMAADHPFFIGEKMLNHSWSGWEQYEHMRDGEQISVTGLGVVTMVAKHIAYGEEQEADNRPIFMIFEINGQYYRKSGVADSYGERNWNAGGFLPAVKKTKVVEELS